MAMPSMTWDSDVHSGGNGQVMKGRTRQLGLSAEDRRDTLLHLMALREWEAFSPTMPLQYIKTFLMVALEEGKSVTEYAQQARVSNSVMSRHLLDLGERNRHMEAGWGLVTYRPNPLELRKHEYYLTPKGRALHQAILRAQRGISHD